MQSHSCKGIFVYAFRARKSSYLVVTFLVIFMQHFLVPVDRGRGEGSMDPPASSPWLLAWDRATVHMQRVIWPLLQVFQEFSQCQLYQSRSSVPTTNPGDVIRHIWQHRHSLWQRNFRRDGGVVVGRGVVYVVSSAAAAAAAAAVHCHSNGDDSIWV